METYSTKQVGVWLDQAKAYLIGMQEGNAFLMEIIESKIPRLKREEGESDDKTRFSSDSQHSSSNEFKKNQIKTNELKSYFRKLQNKLKDFEDILIIGPGTIKDQFFNALMENQEYDGKSIEVQTKGKFSENQLMAYINDFFTP